MRFERELFKRKVFISFPDEEPIKAYVDTTLRLKILDTYSKILPVCYLDFEQNGDFTKIIFDEIAFSNAIIAFIKNFNSNVMLEVGRATALGKPYIAVAPKNTTLPSLLKKELTIFYDGEYPSAKELKQIMDAIEKAVIRPSHREKINLRQSLQHKLLTGMKGLKKHTNNDFVKQESLVNEQARRDAENEFHNGNFITAIDILHNCIRDGYKTEAVYHLIADSFFLLGEGANTQYEAENFYDEMLSISQEGLVLFPGSMALRKDLALALQKSGRFTDAKAILEQLLIEAHEPVYLYNLACVHCLLGNRIDCLKYLEQAIKGAKYYQTLARMDPDFENMWMSEMFQALLFQLRLE